MTQTTHPDRDTVMNVLRDRLQSPYAHQSSKAQNAIDAFQRILDRLQFLERGRP